jgi:hypothetical protein
LERLRGPIGAAEDCRLARDDLRAYPLPGGNEGSGDVTAAQVFGERGSDLPRDELAVEPLDQNGRPWPAEIMQRSIGNDRMKFVRDAYSATLRALAFSSSVAGLRPRIFC